MMSYFFSSAHYIFNMTNVYVLWSIPLTLAHFLCRRLHYICARCGHLDVYRCVFSEAKNAIYCINTHSWSNIIDNLFVAIYWTGAILCRVSLKAYEPIIKNNVVDSVQWMALFYIANPINQIQFLQINKRLILLNYAVFLRFIFSKF